MNIAIIFAGGTGKRMNSKTRPKQFLELNSKPILVYTVEHFQNNPYVDGIIIVCLEGWIEYCKELVTKFNLNKVSAIVPGGETGQMSIYNGLAKAAELYPEDSIVLIHDGVRPLIDDETISNCITCVMRHGSAITVSPAVETIALKTKDGKVGEIIDREICQMAKAPQCFYLNEILEAHEKAIKEGKLSFIDSASIMNWVDHSLYIVEGPAENIKITTPNDFYMFCAIMDTENNTV